MSKALRLSEKLFNRGLWAVALVFAYFLVGLGSLVVNDLPKVEATLSLEQFIDSAPATQLRNEIARSRRVIDDATQALEQAQQKQRVARADTRALQDSFANWLSTRQATQRASQDPEVISRTQVLDTARQAERQAQAEVERQQQVLLDARQSGERSRRELSQLESEGHKRLAAARNHLELRVFLYRLALTLPLLAVAAWLFLRKRRSTWWPFVWGFIFFAAFTFFVELVPYLPSYGGYVRYVVGIVLTAVIGQQVIRALQRYLERQRQAEQLPDARRRTELGYDTALARLAKGVCPGCERGVDLKNESIDFCPHCGISLFDRCGQCRTRKGAFAHYCHACGAPAGTQPQADDSLAPA